jgi:hypothetical protein
MSYERTGKAGAARRRKVAGQVIARSPYLSLRTHQYASVHALGHRRARPIAGGSAVLADYGNDGLGFSLKPPKAIRKAATAVKKAVTLKRVLTAGAIVGGAIVAGPAALAIGKAVGGAAIRGVGAAGRFVGHEAAGLFHVKPKGTPPFVGSNQTRQAPDGTVFDSQGNPVTDSRGNPLPGTRTAPGASPADVLRQIAEATGGGQGPAPSAQTEPASPTVNPGGGGGGSSGGGAAPDGSATDNATSPDQAGMAPGGMPSNGALLALGAVALVAVAVTAARKRRRAA